MSDTPSPPSTPPPPTPPEPVQGGFPQTQDAPLDPTIPNRKPPLPGMVTGWKTLLGVGIAIVTMILPVGALSIYGNQIGPLTVDYPADNPIVIEGTKHNLEFKLPYTCVKDLSDPATQIFICNQDGKDTEIQIRSHEEINDYELTSKRAVRELTLNRWATDFPAQNHEFDGGKIAEVSGHSLIEQPITALTIVPVEGKDGFTITLQNPEVHPDSEEIIAEAVTKIIEHLKLHTNPEEEAA